jgi:hypothetical protein
VTAYEEYEDIEREFRKKELDLFYIPQVDISEAEELCSECDGRGLILKYPHESYYNRQIFTSDSLELNSPIITKPTITALSICEKCMSIGKVDWITNIIGVLKQDWYTHTLVRLENILCYNIFRKVGNFFNKEEIQNYLYKLYERNIIQTWSVSVDFDKILSVDSPEYSLLGYSRIYVSFYSTFCSDRINLFSYNQYRKDNTCCFNIALCKNVRVPSSQKELFLKETGISNETIRFIQKI